MEINKNHQGELIIYELINGNGVKVEVLNLGGTITKILVPDSKGNFENVVLAYNKYEDYFINPSSFGCIVGRTAGRIGNGKVNIDGKEYSFYCNNNHNSLHGGKEGFNKKLWSGKIIEGKDEITLKLSYLSKDGEEGYPGNLSLDVYYTLSNNNELIINYKGNSDKNTIVNLTNHSYFNLSGSCKRNILNQDLFINSDYICELDKFSIPTGKILNVLDTPFDFRSTKVIGKDINDNTNQQIAFGSGYDHPWILNNNDDIAVTIYDSESGRAMDVKTNQKAVVVYSMNFTDDLLLDTGKQSNKRDAICFEAQGLPIGYNDCFANEVILKAGEEYNNETKFRFYVK